MVDAVEFEGAEVEFEGAIVVVEGAIVVVEGGFAVVEELCLASVWADTMTTSRRQRSPADAILA